MLDESQGIANTLKIHNAKYRKVCRTYCSDSRLRRFTEREDCGEHISPKKLRSSSAVASSPQKYLICIIREEQDERNLHTVETDKADVNLRNWARQQELPSSRQADCPSCRCPCCRHILSCNMLYKPQILS